MSGNNGKIMVKKMQLGCKCKVIRKKIRRICILHIRRNASMCSFVLSGRADYKWMKMLIQRIILISTDRAGCSTHERKHRCCRYRKQPLVFRLG